MIKPSEVIARERARQWPWTAMMGCSEHDTVVRDVCEWLAEHGDRWDVSIPIESISRSWNLRHGHAGCDPHNFAPRYINADGILTQEFLQAVANPRSGE